LTKVFSLRVDVDTVRGLVDGISPIVDLCDELGIKATFFVTVGVDTAARAFLDRPRISRHRSISPLKKYGIREILGSLKGLSFAKHGERMRALEKKGHEVQLHCYDHVEWVKRIRAASPDEAEEMIRRGLRAFEGILGRRPAAFASPAFLVTDAVLEAEDKLGFLYASDYALDEGSAPFTPAGRSVLQIPVNAPLIEDLVAEGNSDDEILRRTVTLVRRNPITVMYIHASYEPRLKRDLLSSILLDVLQVADVLTFQEIFEAWNR